MARQLTDFERKQIVADYVELGSYFATAKRHGIADTTVKRIVAADSEMLKNAERKKEQDAADILAYMDGKKEAVKKIIDLYLEALLDEEKIAKASPSQLTTAMGTLIDKFTAAHVAAPIGEEVDDPLTKALMEEAERMEAQNTTKFC